ncbi:hypothetical protein [Neisseria gonorrhoeae]|uniref:hypothetical protein n=1 Tax=Neisseria gonorrhoeae TaxID=485 RepID=UPI0021CE46A0|nr:hypothetical protein [Neisseria gonorrhoeae]MCU4680175.1 hypothetical protein [Neisseria gonorrhoeae]
MPSLAACAAEEKRREERKKREEKKVFCGWIHFRLIIRFNRLKKIFTDVEGRIISASGGVSTQYGGLTKTGTALPPGSKGTVRCQAPGGSVPYHLYCLRPAALS